MPKCNVCGGFVGVVVLDVFGDTLETFCPMPGILWWWCCWIDPHSDEAVGRALLVVVGE